MNLFSLPPARLVNSQDTLSHMVADLKKQLSIAVDTESNSLHAYQERVCLMQISTPETDYLVDPFPIQDMTPLGEVFADAKIQKVFHAGDYDLATLKRDFGFEFVNIFDTMLAATALAEPSIGLAALLDKYFDIQLEKKYQRANWGKRPLDPEMLVYAQGDSHYLLQLRDLLVEKLKETNRLEFVLEDSAALARITLPMKDHEEDLWRVKGSQDLKPTALSLLKQLNHLREKIAEQRDVPPFKVFSDKAMIEIATTQPKYIEQLGLLPSLSPALIKRYGKQMMQVVKKWRENPIVVNPRKNHRLADREMKLREKLSDWRKEIGEKEGIPSNAVLSRDLVERIAHHDPQSEEQLIEVMHNYPHHYAAYGQEILAVTKRKKK
ncbi:MAG: HRDC domain-containing protein [Anaerolineaceae bacterium]|jgi:ribonuclease D|nr:HRDC domain-containing protein [Anaerolineaceae bacterium]